ncbi:MAG: Hsp20/alpha crystallin family protein [Vicinamibacterales bacterium]
MEIVKWNPFRELEEIQRRLNRMFTDTGGQKMGEEPFFMADWAPAVDIRETDKAFAVKVDLPDVKKEDLKVEMHDGILTIEGERKQEKEEKGDRFHRIERQYGTFVRRFTMPAKVDEANVAAEFKDGVLTIALPKAVPAVVKPVEVKVA